MKTTTEILSQIGRYVSSLDWAYMLTFIIITIGINSYCLNRKTEAAVKTRTRYRVAFIGLLYGCVLYFTRKYTVQQAEILFQSFVFALVFHKLIIEAVVYWLVKNGLPDTIASHLLDDKTIQALKGSALKTPDEHEGI